MSDAIVDGLLSPTMVKIAASLLLVGCTTVNVRKWYRTPSTWLLVLKLPPQAETFVIDKGLHRDERKFLELTADDLHTKSSMFGTALNELEKTALLNAVEFDQIDRTQREALVHALRGVIYSDSWFCGRSSSWLADGDTPLRGWFRMKVHAAPRSNQLRVFCVAHSHLSGEVDLSALPDSVEEIVLGGNNKLTGFNKNGFRGKFPQGLNVLKLDGNHNLEMTIEPDDLRALLDTCPHLSEISFEGCSKMSGLIPPQEEMVKRGITRLTTFNSKVKRIGGPPPEESGNQNQNHGWIIMSLTDLVGAKVANKIEKTAEVVDTVSKVVKVAEVGASAVEAVSEASKK